MNRNDVQSKEIQGELDQVNEKLKASTESCRIDNGQLPNKKKKIQDLTEEHRKAGEEERRAEPLRAEKAEAVSLFWFLWSILGL